MSNAYGIIGEENRKIGTIYGTVNESYYELDYIQSSGTQYIDTGFALNQDTRIVMDAQVTTQPSAHAWLFGARGTGYNQTKNLFLLSGKTWNADYYDYTDRASFSGIGVLDRLTIDYNKNTLSVNGTSHTWTAANFQCPHNLILFANNDNGTVKSGISAKLYSCKVYDNGVLIRDYVPCATPSGTVGLFDKVNQSFAANAGNGIFTAGTQTGTQLEVSAHKKINKVYGVVSGVHKLVWEGTTISETLNDNDWSVIQSIAAAGTAANYWSVGDRKAVAISGTVGSASLSGTYYAYILGINHNQSIEGNGIHFQFGFTATSGGVHVAFCDSSYNEFGSDAMFHMNSSLTNSGGWESSYMRQTICSQFLSALPSALQSAIASTTKYTDNTGGGSNIASYVTSTSDKIFLLAEFELQGARTYANSAEQNYQKQYSYYANGNSKRMYKHNDTSTAAWWWMRSPDSDGLSYTFCYADTYGGPTYSQAHYSEGFAPGFRVG